MILIIFSLTYLRCRCLFRPSPTCLPFSQRPAGHEHNLAKEAAQSGCCQRPQKVGAGATSGAWKIFAENFVLSAKAVVESSLKTLGNVSLGSLPQVERFDLKTSKNKISS